MIRTYSIPMVCTHRIVTVGDVNTCHAWAEGLAAGDEVVSLTRPAGSEDAAVEDVRDQLDKRYARFRRASVLT